MIPCSYRASACKAVLPSCMAFYVISVRQTGDLPVVSLFPHPASFRFHLTMDTLAFGYILPTTGRIRDFNPLETCAARRTTQKRSCKDAGARRTAPWTARFDGFVKHRNPKKHNSYSILTVKRSLQESTCATPGARGARTDLQSKKYIIILYYVKPARIRLHLAGHKLLSLSCSDGKLLVFDAHTSPRLDR